MTLPAVGKLGRYQIVRELSEGAMGTVFEAVDPLIERTVAIKTIKLDFSGEELAKFEQHFLREAKSAGRLNHPNIVTIYDVGEANDVAYLAMEYLEGETLRELLDSGIPLSPGRAVWIAGQVAEALAYAEEHGIVHRDVKPANIVITRRGAVKLTDFGIAMLPLGSRTQTGMVMGSPKYMSPEQATGQTVDSRSDIFSLGVVLYEMLAGKPPFDGDNLSAILYRVINVDPPPLLSLNPLIAPGLERIVFKMLEKKPERRYENAKALARELREYQTSTAVTPTAANDHADPAANMAAGRAFANRAWRRKEFVFGVAALAALAVIASLIAVGTREKKEEAPLAAASTPRREAAPAAASTAQREMPLIPSVSAPAVAAPGPSAPPVDTSAAVPDVQAPVDEASEKVEKPQPVPASGKLAFAIAPWGEVYVDSKKVGVSPPMREFKLPPGRHRVEIRNTHFVPYSETVVVAPASTRKIKHKFQ